MTGPYFIDRRSRVLLLHILGCVTFLILPLVIAPRPDGTSVLSSVTLRDFLANCFMLLIFYLNYYQFIPALYFKGRQILYTFIIILGLVMMSIIPSLLTGHAPWDSHRLPSPETAFRVAPPLRDHPESENVSSFLIQVRHNILLYIAVILFSILLRVRMKLLETERLKHHAELGTLRNQINPHFLFNTLNNIYAFAIRERASLTASSILKLSGMMRYVVTETSSEFVPLQKEINYTNDYIELVKMRITETLHLSYVVTGTITDQKIAPLVLMPFIENAFKHGVNPDKESYISIRIEIANTELMLTVENQKVNLHHSLNGRSGIGIENTKSRLELHYPKNYFLSIHEDPDHYRVQLNIELS